MKVEQSALDDRTGRRNTSDTAWKGRKRPSNRVADPARFVGPRPVGALCSVSVAPALEDGIEEGPEVDSGLVDDWAELLEQSVTDVGDRGDDEGEVGDVEHSAAAAVTGGMSSQFTATRPVPGSAVIVTSLPRWLGTP